MRFDVLADWLAWQETLHPQAIDLGLGRVRTVYEALRLPSPPPFTLTVGGTNGKGSCVAMLTAILRAAGYRVGAYTSPHILNYNERIAINGVPATDDRIMAAFQRIDQARGDVSLSFFEFGTLAALDIFAGENLDVQILEVGLGGRLDAVNIIDPDMALIASIDIDHEEWLGKNRDAIGLEKAGIFRPGRHAVVGDPDIPNAVTHMAQASGVHLDRLGHEFRFETCEQGWHWMGCGIQYRQLPLPAIPGDHQLMNASAVLQALHRVSERLPVSEAAIRSGLVAVRLPGRFQFFPGKVPVLLDVAHNPQSVRVLADHLRRQFPHYRVSAVFSVMRDKDAGAMVATLRDVVDRWYLAPLGMTRAARPDELNDILHNAGIKAIVSGFCSVQAASDAARAEAGPGDLVLVFGSFFLVSEFLAQQG